MDAQRLATPENLDGQPTLPLPAARLGAPGPLGGGRLRPRPMGAAMIQPFFSRCLFACPDNVGWIGYLSLVFLSPRWAGERASERARRRTLHNRTPGDPVQSKVYFRILITPMGPSWFQGPCALLSSYLPACRVVSDRSRMRPLGGGGRARASSPQRGGQRSREQRAPMPCARMSCDGRTETTEPLAVDGDLSHYVRARYCASAHHDGTADNALLLNRAGPASSLARAHVGGGGGSLFPEQCSNRACVSSSVRVRARA